MELQDSTGVVVRTIATADSTAAGSKDPSGADISRGTWQGPNLVVPSAGPEGRQVTQTYSLTDDGQTLKVTTHIDASGDRPAADFTRVYHRKRNG